jgi:hypothetical protein
LEDKCEHALPHPHADACMLQQRTMLFVAPYINAADTRLKPAMQQAARCDWWALKSSNILFVLTQQTCHHRKGCYLKEWRRPKPSQEQLCPDPESLMIWLLHLPRKQDYQILSTQQWPNKRRHQE